MPHFLHQPMFKHPGAPCIQSRIERFPVGEQTELENAVAGQGIASLFEQAHQIGRTLGLELTEGATGGGSDANFTAALGVPTLDGLGARGCGAHADDEHILIDSLPERAALLAALLLELQVEP